MSAMGTVDWYLGGYDLKVVWLTLPLDPEINSWSNMEPQQARKKATVVAHNWHSPFFYDQYIVDLLT
eukprot:2961415-Prorocentrum_lima.AAC.1